MSDPETNYVRAMIDVYDARFESATADLTARVDALREEWSSNAADQVAASEARIRQIQEDNLIWLRSRYGDDGDERPQDVAGAAGHGADGASSVLTGTPGGHNQRPPQPNPNDEIERARAIRDMSMQDWSEVRKTLIRTSGGLFG